MTHPPKRRWPQFRLPLLLLLVALLASVLAWRNAARELAESERRWKLTNLEWRLSRRVERLNRPSLYNGYPLLTSDEIRLDPEASKLINQIESLDR
jgi:hypothetical protein